jgi:AraC-like DNA-binding protein/effector-binding domain-containing protein
MNVSMKIGRKPNSLKATSNKLAMQYDDLVDKIAKKAPEVSAKISGQGLYLKKKLLEAGDLASAARTMGQSSVSMVRQCKQALGQTPGRIIRESKLIDAARALVLGQQRILHVALDYGYGSQEAFSRAFSRFFGRTPAELKRHYISLQDELTGMPQPSFRKVNMPELKGLGYEYSGAYSDIEPAIADLFRWALARGLLRGGNISPSVIYKGHPWVFDQNSLKALIILPIEHAGDAERGIVPVVIPSGPVYECIHQGPYSTVLDTYNLMLKAVSQRHTPCFAHEAAIVTFCTRSTNSNTQEVVSSELESIVRIRAEEDSF